MHVPTPATRIHEQNYNSIIFTVINKFIPCNHLHRRLEIDNFYTIFNAIIPIKQTDSTECKLFLSVLHVVRVP